MAKPAFRVAAEAEGLAGAIRTLGKVDGELKKQLVKEMKQAGEPLVATARALVPAASPLTNWYNWTTPKGREIGPFIPSKAKRGIKISQRNTAQRGSDGRREQTIRLLALVQTNAAGAIYDMAGRANGSGRDSEGEQRGREMIKKLNSFAESSRTLWPAAEKELSNVQQAVKDAIQALEDELNAELERR